MLPFGVILPFYVTWHCNWYPGQQALSSMVSLDPLQLLLDQWNEFQLDAFPSFQDAEQWSCDLLYSNQNWNFVLILTLNQRWADTFVRARSWVCPCLTLIFEKLMNLPKILKCGPIRIYYMWKCLEAIFHLKYLW